MRWKDVGCGSLHVRHIGFDLSYDTAALLFWRVLHLLSVPYSSIFSNTTHCRMASIGITYDITCHTSGCAKNSSVAAVV